MFGKSAFGSTSTGAGSAFGASRPSGSLFGATTGGQTTSVFGQPAASSTGATTSSVFGARPATGSSLFGSTQPQQTTQQGGTGLFGSNQNASSGVFGSTRPSLFGPTQSAGGGTAFGSPSSGGGLFGSSSNTSGGGLFGSSSVAMPNGTTIKFEPVISTDTMAKNGTTQNISTKHICITAMKQYEPKSLEELRIDDYVANRKAPTSTGGGGLFGSTSSAIGTSTATSGGGLFGQAQQKSSLFGSGTSTFGTTPATQTPSSIFGTSSTQQTQVGSQPGTSTLFGPKPSGGLFGSTSTSGTFGQPAQLTGGIFGSTGTNQQTSGSGLFGSQPAAQSGGGLFGSTTGTGAFGQPAAQQPSGGLFGQPATSTTGGGLFGSKPATGSAFPFGGQQNTGFGQAAAGTSGGLFGAAAKPAGGGLFGSTTGTTTGGGLFGSTQPSTGGGGLFGSAQPTAGTGTTGGGLFSGLGQTGQQQQTGQTGFGSIPLTATVATQQTPIILGSDVNQTQLEMKLIEAQLAASPYGDSPLLKMITSTDDTQEKPNPASAQRQLRFMAVKLNKLSAEKDKPLASGEKSSALMQAILDPAREAKTIDAETTKRAAFNLAGNQLIKSQFMNVLPPKILEKTFRAASVIPAGSPEDLKYTSIVRPPTLGKGIGSRPQATTFYSSRDRSALLNESASKTLPTSTTPGGTHIQLPSSIKKSSNVKFLDLSVLSNLDASFNSPRGRQATGPTDLADPDAIPQLRQSVSEGGNSLTHSSQTVSPATQAYRRDEHLREAEPPVLNLDGTIDTTNSGTTTAGQAGSPNSDSATSVVERTTSSGVSRISHDNLLADNTRREDVHAAGVRLLQPDYFCEPSIETMKSMVKNGVVYLPDGLTIGRASYGSVYWSGPLELKDVVLDELVVFRHKEVTVYPDESRKPPVGEGLNRPAEVTLERVWKRNRLTGEYVKDPLELAEIGWREFLERQTARMNAEFKDYRPLTGSWVFLVQHFSKYGLSDDEDVENVLVQRVKKGGKGNAAADGKVNRVGDTPTTDELEKSFEERDIQARVQRAKIALNDRRGSEDADCLMEFQMHGQFFPSHRVAPELMILDQMHDSMEGDEHDEELLMERQIKRGLTKLEDYARQQHEKQPLSVDAQYRPKSYDFFKQLESIVPPTEKKPKLEEIEGLYTQTEILLNAMTAQRAAMEAKEFRLKQSAPLSKFDGGHQARDSVGYHKSRRQDFGLAMGNAARIGWGAVAGVQIGTRFIVSRQPHSNSVAIGHVDMASDTPKTIIYEMLLAALSHSQWNDAVSQPSAFANNISKKVMPPQTTFKPDCFANLLKDYAKIARDNNLDMHSRIFSLLNALLPSEKRGPWRVERAEQLGEWLRQQLVRKKGDNEERPKGRGALVWQAMCNGDLDEAIRKAEEEKLTHLATFLAAHSIRPDANQKDMRMQLEFWSKTDELQYIQRDMLKVYMLLAGKTQLERIVRGKLETVNCMEGLSWKQALGLHVWWTRGAGTLEDAYERYRDEVASGQAPKADGHFYEELIHLACNPAHRIETVLDALIYLSRNSFNDMCASWLVWSVLRTYGYNSMAAENTDRLHRQFAAQLEAHKATGPAAYVLSHLENEQLRSSAIRQLMIRQAYELELNSALADEIIKFYPKIRPAWLAEARCIVARARGEHAQAFELAIQAEDYELARELYVKEVAPDCIFYLNTAGLRRYSRMIEEVAGEIRGFSDYGQLFVDYAHLKAAAARSDTNQNEETIEEDQHMMDEDRILQLVRSIDAEVRAAVWSRSPIQRHCIATISRELYEIKASLLGEHDFSLPFEQATDLQLMHRLAQHAIFEGL